ncbi:hypothetical protein C0992_002434 [Termitomyces sp. T32_za158]|nr:hypothetical protein C0992_002434 [Termitomyces sp. T32_za158]
MSRLVSFVSIVLLALAGRTTSSTQADDDNYLSLHNAARAQYSAASLTWNATLASEAQVWADRCVFEHSEGALGPYGGMLLYTMSRDYLSIYNIPENLAIAFSTSNFTDVMDNWMDEAFGSEFTQVVWKSTDQVGCASQTCDDMIPGFPVCDNLVSLLQSTINMSLAIRE